MAESQSTPAVEIQGGKVSGVYEDDGRIAVFKGIPYARPPIGDLRWRPPEPVQSWNGVREAVKHGPMAWQAASGIHDFFNGLIDGQGWGVLRSTAIKLIFRLMPHGKQDEDCLYLNIRTPVLDPEAKLPVMVWIHGGDHQDGSGHDPYYTANALPGRGVVLVTINYRLGLMGYFTHPDLSRESEHGVSGNYGTLDQIAALAWVRDNIAGFGGDPDNVTIFGESAGGESVAHMLTSPLARGLFSKAILESAANSGQMGFLTKPFAKHLAAEEKGWLFALKFVSPGSDKIGALRRIPAKILQQTVTREKNEAFFYPVIDGWVLEKSPFEAFLNGDQARVPMLLGSNSHEGTLIYPMFQSPVAEMPPMPEPSGIPAYLKEAFGDDADEMMKLYPGLSEGRSDAGIALTGDCMFGHKARFYAVQAARADQPVYFYHFNRVPPSPRQTAGAFHAAEIPFVHGSKVPILPLTEEDNALVKIMGDYWTGFAKTGDPNGGDNPDWPRFSPDEQEWMLLGPQVGPKPIDRKDKYDILDRRLIRLIEEMKTLRSEESS